MGNSEENIIAIDPFFYQVCHRKLSFGKINDKLKTIEINIPYNQQYHQWRWNLYPMYSYSKYLMMPKYFIDNDINVLGCEQKNKESPLFLSITVGYDPFIYTLQKEIMSRKLSHQIFSQKQILKIAKYLMYGLSCWIHVYPDLPLGQISPKNIIFDAKGHSRLVHIFSFPPQDFISMNGNAFHYNQINPKQTLLKKGPRLLPSKSLTNSLKQLVSTLLSTLFLSDQHPHHYEEYLNKIQVCQNISFELKKFMEQIIDVQSQEGLRNKIDEVQKIIKI